MKTAHLSGSLRTNVGKKDASLIRNSGMVPCVLYGQGEQTHFAVKRVAIEKIVFSPEVYQVELDIEGKKSIGIIRELQQHPTKDTIQHVDFYELDPAKPVTIFPPWRTLIFFTVLFATVLPNVACPSAPMTTSPLWRIATTVVDFIFSMES